MDPFILSRIQFATNISFHILFPSITIALGWILLFFKVKFNRTNDVKWMDCYRFWVKIFALCFALGVVSGITMSFQFGTNWPGFMLKVGNIAGPLLAYEVLTAFFLEATFLGIMLFGFNKVSNKVHNLATILVAFGTTFSAFWILVLNSWMHTPAGYEIKEGVVHATNWLEVLFNPSFPYRMLHMLIASGLTASFLVAGVSAYRLLKKDKSPAVISALKTGIYLAAFLVPVQILVGHAHGVNTFKYQPAKIAAMEGVWETKTKAPLVLFAVPNEKTRSNDLEVSIPNLASLIVTGSIDGEIKGLNEFKGNHPPVSPVFFAFRVMVGVGVLMLVAAWYGAWKLNRKNNIGKKFAYVLVLLTFSGWVAVLAGWYVTEIGRQPWLVTGVLTTKDAVADIATPLLTTSLTIYLALYAILIGSFVSVVFYLARKAGEENKNSNEIGFATKEFLTSKK
ncbi:MAG: cytochrome ubiquinol oxidase subunit I [Alphaproteobacteria bacterium]|jgi:cytochrome d ubiquinol oxidase subunit I